LAFWDLIPIDKLFEYDLKDKFPIVFQMMKKFCLLVALGWPCSYLLRILCATCDSRRFTRLLCSLSPNDPNVGLLLRTIVDLSPAASQYIRLYWTSLSGIEYSCHGRPEYADLLNLVQQLKMSAHVQILDPCFHDRLKSVFALTPSPSIAPPLGQSRRLQRFNKSLACLSVLILSGMAIWSPRLFNLI